MWTAQVLEAVPLVDEGLGQTSAELLSDMSAGLAGFQAVLVAVVCFVRPPVSQSKTSPRRRQWKIKTQKGLTTTWTIVGSG